MLGHYQHEDAEPSSVSTYGAVHGEFTTLRARRSSKSEQRLNRTAATALVMFIGAAATLAYVAFSRSPSSGVNTLDTVPYQPSDGTSAQPYQPSDGTSAQPMDGAEAASDDESSPAAVQSTESSKNQTEFLVTNAYTNAHGAVAMGYPFIEAYKVMEPYRAATFTVSEPKEQCSYSWTLIHHDNEVHSAVGSQFVHTVNTTGNFKVQLVESSSPAQEVVSDECIGTTVAHVRSRYVRRELRALTPEDLSEWFDTVEVVYKTDCTDGMHKYGGNFECIDNLVRAHNELAGDTYCDHMHDGYGFVTQHAALTRWFELALQSVNPKVAAHYWDYTIEGEIANQTNEISTWRESAMFAADKFGDANTNGIITSGRFGYTQAKSKAQNFTNTYNAYGYMRAPWNQNPAPYVTRYNTTYGINFAAVPGCHSHQKVLEYTDWMEFGKEIAYAPHGTTHMMIGGIGHADMATELLSMGYDMELAREWVPTAFAFQKNMFRAGMLMCPETCSIDTPTSDCKCVCPKMHLYEEMPDDQLWNTVLYRVMATDYAYVQNKSGHFIGKEVLSMLCNNYERMAPIMGDSLESASPTDVSFWPTHPTVERLFQWRRLNGFSSTHWPDNTAWSVEGFMTEYCSGHNKDDILTWPSHIFEPAQTGPYTNRDVWNLTDPLKEYSDYIYDSFEWKHCEERGYNINLIDTTLVTSA